MEPVPTKCLQMKQQPFQNFKVVAHTKNKEKKSKKTLNIMKKNETPQDSVDMKRARFEVYKFSKSNLSASNRQKSNIELAILLGAKPPKKEAKNYKLLKADRKLEATQKEEAKYLKQLSNNFNSTMKNKKNKLNLKDQGILSQYGKAKLRRNHNSEKK